MSIRKLAGVALIAAAVRPLQAAISSALALTAADWSSIDASGAMLSGVIIFIVALIGIVGLATVAVGIAYLRGMRRRLAGLFVVAPNAIIAAIALAEGPSGSELLVWGAYAAIVAAALLLLLLPAPSRSEAAAE